MLNWLTNHWLTLVVLAIVAVALAAVILRMIRNKRRGITSCACGGGCSGCSMHGMCHANQASDQK